MSELLIELFSEEMPPNLQINARNQFKKFFGEALLSLNLKYKSFEVYSTPTRLTATVSGLPSRIKILPTEIKGPKLGVPQSVVESFAKSKNIKLSDLYEKKLEKGVFYFAKTKGKEIIIEEELIKNIPKSLGQISWKKSMKWSNHDLDWGRPLRSILSIFNKKYLKFNYGHIQTVNFTLIEDGLEIKQKRIKDFKDYEKFLKKKRNHF